MGRRTFSREFKLEAVNLLTERGMAASQAARDLGMAVSMVGRWVREGGADKKQAFPGRGQMKADDAEVARLKRPQSARSCTYATLTAQIQRSFSDSDLTYGARRVRRPWLRHSSNGAADAPGPVGRAAQTPRMPFDIGPRAKTSDRTERPGAAVRQFDAAEVKS